MLGMFTTDGRMKNRQKARISVRAGSQAKGKARAKTPRHPLSIVRSNCLRYPYFPTYQTYLTCSGLPCDRCRIWRFDRQGRAKTPTYLGPGLTFPIPVLPVQQASPEALAVSSGAIMLIQLNLFTLNAGPTVGPRLWNGCCCIRASCTIQARDGNSCRK